MDSSGRFSGGVPSYNIDGVIELFLTALSKNGREVETREMMVLGMGTFDADIIVFVVWPITMKCRNLLIPTCLSSDFG